MGSRKGGGDPLRVEARLDGWAKAQKADKERNESAGPGRQELKSIK